MQVTLHEDNWNLAVHRELGPIDTGDIADGGSVERLVRDLDFARLPAELPGQPIPDPLVRRVDVDGHAVVWNEPGTEPPTLLRELWATVASQGEWRDVPPGG
jgi:hypothetical protein